MPYRKLHSEDFPAPEAASTRQNSPRRKVTSRRHISERSTAGPPAANAAGSTSFNSIFSIALRP